MRAAEGSGATISGTVTFSQDFNDPLGDVTVKYDVQGLRPGLHGFHIHQYGDTRVTADLSTFAAHFEPVCSPQDPGTNRTADEVECDNAQEHGYPHSHLRHIGDMGNLSSSGNGRASGEIVLGQRKMSLTDATRSIVGRSVIVHVDRDKGSRNAFGARVFPYGGAGNPLAYGVAAIAKPSTGTVNMARGPNNPQTTKVICNFEQPLSSQPATDIRGFALLTLLEAEGGDEGGVLVQAVLNGFEKRSQKRAFHFHEWGDLSNSLSDIGDVFESDGISVSSIEITNEGEGFYEERFASSSSILSFVGRSIAVHASEASSSDIVAAATCGLAFPTAELDANAPENKDEGLAAWAIVLMVVASVIVCTVALVGVLYFFRLPIPFCGRCFYPYGRSYTSKFAPPPPKPAIPLEPTRPAGAPDRKQGGRV